MEPEPKQSHHTGPELAAAVKAAARRIGYTDCGIAPARPFPDYARALERLVERFPETRALYERMRHRADPCVTTPWARSSVVCIRRYGKYRLPEGLDRFIGRNYLADRRTPACPDHDMPQRMTAELRALGLRVKKGGVPDRSAAARAGVARIGRNTFAYSDHGSWINVESWRINAELPCDEPTPEPPCPDGCRKCLDACPTGAIVEPFMMRMDRCIAYLTYDAPEPVPPELRENMGTWVYGCDVCQQVCPLNRGKWEALECAPWLDVVADKLTPEALADMNPETYRDVVLPLFWYIPADDLERWRRNARRACGAQERGHCTVKANAMDEPDDTLHGARKT